MGHFSQLLEVLQFTRMNPFYRRTSINSPTGRLLCDEHIQRLKAHQACVFCGQFCAYGIFMMCRPSSKCKPHLFHRKCFVR